MLCAYGAGIEGSYGVLSTSGCKCERGVVFFQSPKNEGPPSENPELVHPAIDLLTKGHRRNKKDSHYSFSTRKGDVQERGLPWNVAFERSG